MITTAMALCCLVMRHKYKLAWSQVFTHDKETRLFYRHQESISDKVDMWVPQKTGPFYCRTRFIIEFLILAAVPLPGTHHILFKTTTSDKSTVTYNLDEILLSVMVLRGFFILRAFTNYS